MWFLVCIMDYWDRAQGKGQGSIYSFVPCAIAVVLCTSILFSFFYIGAGERIEITFILDYIS